ncbi:PREDICTED: sciellin-like [Nanorana parkeri]|uniref:sciellin-like n=1 Tax=Nanorana parkeri TaxID=125878 RepID=UPI000854C6B0|nr:PREDICTED: sciellin-like [Nanorana parkeri]
MASYLVHRDLNISFYPTHCQLLSSTTCFRELTNSSGNVYMPPHPQRCTQLGNVAQGRQGKVTTDHGFGLRSLEPPGTTPVSENLFRKMSTYKFGSDPKSNTLGSTNRQNVIQETNKKRTLLKDSSWIKSKPEEEEEKIKEENFGRSVLNKYKSTEHLDRDNDKEEKTPIHNRFKSDDALDRISLRNTSERGNKSATLERMPMSEPDPINKSRQSWAPSNKTTTTTTTEESKRKSWAPTNRNTTTTTTTTSTETKQVVPTKTDAQKITIYSSDTRTTDKPTKTNFIDSVRSRFEKAEEKPSPPTSPPARNDIRPAYPAKPVPIDSGERRTAVERKQRSQDLDNLIGVSSSNVVNKKG